MTTASGQPSQGGIARWSGVGDVIVLSDGAVITWVSPSVTAVLGYAHGDLVGVSIYDLVHPSEFEVMVGLRGALHRDGAARLRCRIRHQHGGWRWIDARLTSLPANRSDPRSSLVLAFWRDVTDLTEEPGQDDGSHTGADVGADEVRARLRSDGTITWIHSSVTSAYGHVPADLLGVPFAALVHPGDRRRAFEAQRGVGPDEPRRVDVRLQAADGAWRPTTVTLRRDVDPTRAGITMSWRSQSAAHILGVEPAGAPLVPTAVPTVMLVDHVADVLVHEHGGRIASVSPSVTRALGWSTGELVGRPLDGLVHADDLGTRADRPAPDRTWKARHRVLARDGAWHWVEAHVTGLLDADGAPMGAVESWRIIDDQVAIERELVRRATQDGLTGLLNRDTVVERLGHLLDPRQSVGTVVALVYIDVDDFKGVNDRYGHAIGDEILVRLARTVRSVVRQDDLVGRLGGDEILVVLRSIDDLGTAANVAIKILAAARSVARTPQGAALPTLSVGVTLARPPEDVADALARADRAMYQAKRAGGDHVVTRAERTT